MTLQLRAGLGRAVLSLLGGQGGTWRSTSPVDVPAEEVVLHQHVLDALLQGLLLLLHETALLSRLLGTQQGSQVAEAREVLTGGASTQGPPEALATRKHLGEAAPGTDASLPHLPQSPGRQAPTHLSLCRKLPVLGEAECEAAEDPGGRGGCQMLAGAQPTPPGLREPRAASPQLALDLDPAGAAQEGPGLVPPLHGRQAGAEHLQPQVQHLLAAGGGGGVPAQRPAPPAPPLPPAAEVSSPPPARGPQLATPLLAGQEAQYALSSSREPPPPGQRSLDAAPLPGGKSRNPMLSLAPRGWHPSACSQVPGEL